MTADIQRMTSLPFGAFALPIGSSEDQSLGGILQWQNDLIEKIKSLAVGTQQYVCAVTMEVLQEDNVVAVIMEGNRATAVYEGCFVVRSTAFGSNGKARLVVMNDDRFAKNFGRLDAGFPLPSFPDGLWNMGYSEDEAVKRDYGLT